MRAGSPKSKSLTWAQRLKAMRVGDSFITNAGSMKKLYIIARRLRLKLKAASQKQACPVTSSALVRVELIGGRRSGKASPIRSQRAVEWRERRKTFSVPPVHPLESAFAPTSAETRTPPRHWQKLLTGLNWDESFVAPAAMRTTIYKAAKRLGLNVKTRGTGGFDVATQTPEMRVSLAAKAGRVGRPRLEERFQTPTAFRRTAL
ncbi:MAG TPA: hypothetical protein VEH27_09390 [Methylomirabilota bacterium]|nr:hypothetical protein [Methylomirabilota bacterium]